MMTPSITFSRPPLDGSLSLTELYDWHYLNNRDYPLFVYEDAPGVPRTISMGEGVQGIHRAMVYVNGEVGPKDAREEAAVVAILSASGEFACSMLHAIF